MQNSAIERPVGFFGDNRPVGDEGDTRPGITVFGNLVHETLDRVFTLASQAANQDWENFSGLEIVQRTGRTCAGSFHDVEVNHGVGGVLSKAEILKSETLK